MKKLFLAIAILALGTGAGYAQANAAKPAQEKTKHIKKSATDNKTAVTQPAASANTTAKKDVAATKAKHHKKMKKEKAPSGK